MDHQSLERPRLWHLCNDKKQKDTQPSAAKHDKASIQGKSWKSRCLLTFQKKKSLPSHLLTNVSGLSSLKELPAAVPVYEIAEHEKGYHTAANIQNRTGQTQCWKLPRKVGSGPLGKDYMRQALPLQ